MSYCRWSDNDFRCDVHVYEDAYGSWTTHVAAVRYVLDRPVRRALYKTNADVIEYAPRVAIELPEDGKTFNDPTPGACADRLVALRELGYRVPQYAIDELRGGAVTVIYDLPERAHDSATEMHEDGAPLVAVLSEAARIAVAEELRRIVAELDELAADSAAPATTGYLLARADELDPPGLATVAMRTCQRCGTAWDRDIPCPSCNYRPLPAVDPATGLELHLCIDADCPACGWGERWFAPARSAFGCSKCSYESSERDA